MVLCFINRLAYRHHYLLLRKHSRNNCKKMGKITLPAILTMALVILIIIGGVHYRNGKYKIRPHPDTTVRKNPMTTTIGVVYDGDTLYLSGLPKPHDSGYKIVIISSRKTTICPGTIRLDSSGMPGFGHTLPHLVY